jgi:predicted MPP superfamily phosphohydrolase
MSGRSATRRANPRATSEHARAIRFPRVALGPARAMTGKERRWLHPRGPVKIFERTVDRVASRYIYPRLFGIWSPYSWQLPRRLEVAEAIIRPAAWPAAMPALSVLVVTDIHVGPFLLPQVLADVLAELMRLQPDLVVIGGDLVSADDAELDPFLEALAPLARAPLGAWFAMGNHEYFTPRPEGVAERLDTIGVATLRNRTVTIAHGGASFRLGGLDDWAIGAPDWDALCAEGAPDLLVSHNPDAFYEATSRGIGLVVSGHTHGGQIRFPGGPPMVRQSRYCLDEGHMTFGDGQLVVSRGLGVSNLPWRLGVRPEALLLTIVPA